MKKDHKPRKGFALGTEAAICLILLTAFITTVETNRPNTETTNLNTELLQQQAQDIVETCIKNNTPKQNCFSKIQKINPNLELNPKGKIAITRRIRGQEKNITFRSSITQQNKQKQYPQH